MSCGECGILFPQYVVPDEDDPSDAMKSGRMCSPATPRAHVRRRRGSAASSTDHCSAVVAGFVPHLALLSLRTVSEPYTWIAASAVRRCRSRRSSYSANLRLKCYTPCLGQSVCELNCGCEARCASQPCQVSARPNLMVTCQNSHTGQIAESPPPD